MAWLQVDCVFADVAQPDQARIVGLNAQFFLKNGGFYIISIKASCIDSTAPPEAVFAREIKKLTELDLRPKEQVGLGCPGIVCCRQDTAIKPVRWSDAALTGREAPWLMVGSGKHACRLLWEQITAWQQGHGSQWLICCLRVSWLCMAGLTRPVNNWRLLHLCQILSTVWGAGDAGALRKGPRSSCGRFQGPF